MRISDWSSDVSLPISQYREFPGLPAWRIADHLFRRQAGQSRLVLVGNRTDHPCAAGQWAYTQFPVAHRLSLPGRVRKTRSEEHTSELQSLMRISYAVFCLKKQKKL